MQGRVVGQGGGRMPRAGHSFSVLVGGARFGQPGTEKDCEAARSEDAWRLWFEHKVPRRVVK